MSINPPGRTPFGAFFFPCTVRRSRHKRSRYNNPFRHLPCNRARGRSRVVRHMKAEKSADEANRSHAEPSTAVANASPGSAYCASSYACAHKPSTRSWNTSLRSAWRVVKCRYNVADPTPACRAISSREPSAPYLVKASPAAASEQPTKAHAEPLTLLVEDNTDEWGRPSIFARLEGRGQWMTPAFN